MKYLECLFIDTERRKVIARNWERRKGKLLLNGNRVELLQEPWSLVAPNANVLNTTQNANIFNTTRHLKMVKMVNFML